MPQERRAERGPPVAAEPANERRASPFRTVRRIALGEDSEIHLASSSRRTSPGTPRWVVVKRLRQDRLADSETRAALVSEVDFVRQLAHPRLPRFFGADAGARSPWFAQEYVDGPDLATLLLEVGKRGRRLDLRAVWQVMFGMAEALQFLHEEAWRSVDGAPEGSPLLHLDLVADNVLVAADGFARLTDLGRGWFVGSDREPPMATRGFTPALAPEQARGQAVDVRSDIFLFGVLFYECLTGRHPFLRDTVHETAREVGRARPLPLETLRPVPPEVAAFVERCLDVAPNGRFSSAAELIVALHALDLPGVDEGQAVLAAEIASVFPGHGGSSRPWVLRGGIFRPPFLPMVLSWLPPPIAGPESPSPAVLPAEGGPVQLGPNTGRVPDPDVEATDAFQHLPEEQVIEPAVAGSAAAAPHAPDTEGAAPTEVPRPPKKRKRRRETAPWLRAGLAAALGAGLTALAFLLFVPRTPELGPTPPRSRTPGARATRRGLWDPSCPQPRPPRSQRPLSRSSFTASPRARG